MSLSLAAPLRIAAGLGWPRSVHETRSLGWPGDLAVPRETVSDDRSDVDAASAGLSVDDAATREKEAVSVTVVDRAAAGDPSDVPSGVAGDGQWPAGDTDVHPLTPPEFRTEDRHDGGRPDEQTAGHAAATLPTESVHISQTDSEGHLTPAGDGGLSGESPAVSPPFHVKQHVRRARDARCALRVPSENFPLAAAASPGTSQEADVSRETSSRASRWGR